MEIPLIGKTDFGPYPTNMFFSQAAHKELNLPGLMGTPGLVEFYDPSSSYPVRGLKVLGNHLYAVIGNKLHQVDLNGEGVAVEGSLVSYNDPVFVEQDGTYLMIVEPNQGGYYYSEAGGSVVTVSDADFPVPSSLAWQDGYFVVTESNSGRFYIPTAYSVTAWDGSDYTTAEATPDDALASISDHREVLIFGSESIQPFYDSGNSTFPFEPIQGAVIQEGLGAAHSIAAGDNTVFFLDKHGRVMRMSGHAVTPISSRYIEDEINDFDYFSDAIGFYYAQQGHGFYVISFPKGNVTWVYDVSTGLWHKRKSFGDVSGTFGRWRANCHALFDGKHIVGDYSNGKLYYLDLDTYTDDSNTILRSFDFPAVGDGQTKIRHNKLKLDYKTGVGLNRNPGPNLLQNPGFEGAATLTGWTAGNSADLDRHADPNTGTYCLEINENGVENPFGYQQVYNVTSGENYEVIAYIKQGTGSKFRVGVWDDQNGSFILYESGTAGAAYAKYSYIIVIPDGCTSITYSLYHDASAEDGTTLLFDDVEFRIANVPPYAMLQWSDDGSKTWSNELTQSLGKLGEYKTEVNFRRLGSSKRRIYRNTISEPVEVVITGAKLN